MKEYSQDDINKYVIDKLNQERAKLIDEIVLNLNQLGKPDAKDLLEKLVQQGKHFNHLDRYYRNPDHSDRPTVRYL